MIQRIVFISIFKKDFGGGEGRVAHEMADYFAQHYQAAMVCPGNDNSIYQAANELTIYQVQSAGDGHFLVPLLSPKNIRNLFDFLDDFNPDVIHAHDPALLGVIGQLWANLHRVPFIFTSHLIPLKILEFGAIEVMTVPKGHLTEAVVEDFVLTFFNNCNAVIALNQTISEGIREFGYHGEVCVIPNGRHLQNYLNCKNTDITKNEKIITFIGFITPRKNQIYLLEVLKCLPANYKLILIGEFLSKPYEKQIRDLVKEWNLTNVEFAGEVSHAQIPQYLEQTHVFVSASKMEVQSLVIIEAMASGTPVVGLENETVDELVDGECGVKLAKNTSPEEFAERIRSICNLTQMEYDQLCQNSRQRVNHLDWKNILQNTIAVYEHLVANRVTYPTPDRNRLLNIISKIPDGSIKDTLIERVVTPIYARRKSTQKIPFKTRVFSWIWVVASMIVYFLLKGPVVLFNKLRAFRGFRKKRVTY
jgi:1,2-diacylglycerol 3-alpha-glucosyltransferase